MPASCWPSPGRHDASKVADRFNREISESVAASVAAGCGRPKLVGLLANDDPAAEVYGRMTRRACEKIGVDYELRRSDRLGLEDALIDANQDPDAHGILVYYPVFGGEKDAYLRDVVSIEKDVEGLSHQYRYSLYHNIRTLEGGKKCVLPCTPLACIKVLEELGAYDSTKSVGKQLSGKVAIVYNRSEVVGRPLAAMLANDGATVYSVDEHGILLYSAGVVHGTIKVEETEKTSAAALASADIVIGGVPVKGFVLAAEGLKPGAICINVSQFMNFGEGTEARCALVPAVGKVTIAILARNLLRLHSNFHTLSPPPRAANRLTVAAISLAAVAAILMLRGKN